MKNEIYLVVDYKGQFGSKSDSEFYRSGMDLKSLTLFFAERKYELKIIKFNEINLKNPEWQNRIVLYTSQEDPGYFYKNYIEDIIYSLELIGAKVIPIYQFLRANNNKVFMELMRAFSGIKPIQNIVSSHFGTYEELRGSNLDFDKQYVMKKAGGATSKGVFLAKGKENILKTAKKIGLTPLAKDDFKDKLRPFKHKGYIKNSPYRKKIVIQNFVEGLQNDWKMLVFGNKFYLEYRGVRENDFRASGSHKFFLNDDIPIPIPNGIFEYAKRVRDGLNTPHLSIDIGFNGKEFFLFEFQALYFSSYAHRKSTCYYHEVNDKFVRVNENFPFEKVYADSICDFIENEYMVC